ncbi:cation:proton antiporter [Arthrobacter sp. SRS-W-1-2016]|uniref:cation:proton antiporter domain-containing protein n=1 Tax=Arthrobacter sp. SRS-W-1-2016 TaxID=1930254 RepID=UPI0011170B60|nr:cation:proton antiporter [Arthrobacter sp. SRS-W-1-2016]
MIDLEPFSLIMLLVAGALLAAVLTHRLSARLRVPAPALFLLAASLASDVVPGLEQIPVTVDERIVTVALVFILFDGGMHIGWHRFRQSAGAIAWIGIAGTAATAAALALVAHAFFGFGWGAALLIGAALSPTDPAVVFSVLGGREITGRTGTILEGESGANDPVGIALMISLLGATGGGLDAVAVGTADFMLQMAVGALIGFLAGHGLLALMRKVALPNEALHSVGTMAAVAFIYAATTLLHGSGFLAVFLAGIIIGDQRAPHKRDIERFSAGIASLAEIVAFTVLGLSVPLLEVLRSGELGTGLALAGLLILIIRPALVGLLTIPIRLRRGERAFILLAGLKGAVPILLGMFILSAGPPDASRIYSIIFIVVLTSVIVQGTLVPYLAALLHVPMRRIDPEPWGIGLRFTDEPHGLHRHVVEPGSPADGSTIAEMALGESGWISMIRRDGQLIQVRGETTLHAGDVVLALSDSETGLARLFKQPR